MANHSEMARDASCGRIQHTTAQSSIPSHEMVSNDSVVDELERRLAVGQRIKSLEDAFSLYNEYARCKGFSIRRGKQQYFHDNSGEIYMKEFECCARGKKDEKRSADNRQPKYHKMDIRTGYTARLRIGRKKGEEWTVTIFDIEHNHEMTAPDQRYTLKSARSISKEKGEHLKMLVLKLGLTVAQAYSVMLESHGQEHVGFMKKDAYHYLSSLHKERRQIENGDANELVRYFKNRSNEDGLFYWDFQVDENNRMCDFFFRDGRCRIDYEAFGDVLSVDSSYKANKYDMICAPFIGINHHKKNVMFGLALISSETEASFQWLFNTFLQSMGDKQPETIFTDQCQAMMKPIETVFPDSHHRFCQWHINQSGLAYFGSLYSNVEFKTSFNKCMKLCDSGEEFEDVWNKMIAKCGLENHPWLKHMYKLKHKWSTVFGKHRFSAGINAISQSEGMDAALGYGGKMTKTLFECVQMFDKVQKKWRQKEKEDDIKCRQEKPTIRVKSSRLLKEAAGVYTPAIYEMFEDELINSLGLELDGAPCQSGTLVVFKVPPENESDRVHKVEFDMRSHRLKCTCPYFEAVGILCMHALLVLKLNNVHKLPDWHIKKRWTKNARNRVPCQEENLVRKDHESERVYVNDVMGSCYDITIQSLLNVDARNLVKNSIKGVASSLNDFFDNLSVTNISSCNVNVGSLDVFNVENLEGIGDKNNVDNDDVRLLSLLRGINNAHH